MPGQASLCKDYTELPKENTTIWYYFAPLWGQFRYASLPAEGAPALNRDWLRIISER